MTTKTVAEIVQEERAKLLDSMSEESIRKQVQDMVSTMTKNTILQLLGFEMRAYSGKPAYWVIDHCNGRAGESAIGTTIKEAVKETLQKKLLNEPQLTPEELSSIHAEVRRYYLDSYRREILTSAMQLGRTHAKEYVQQEVSRVLEGEAELVKLRLLGAAGRETL